MKKILLLILPLFLFSCSNEINELTQTPEKEFEVYNFAYNGEKYSVNYYYAADSTVVFEDPSMKEVLEEIDKNNNLALFIHEDGSVEYFDNIKELERKFELNSEKMTYEAPTSRSPKHVTLTMYEHLNYLGASYTFSTSNDFGITDFKNIQNSPIPMLPVSFNDMLSSFKLTFRRNPFKTQCIITFYRDADFRGYSVSFKTVQLSPISIPSMKKFPLKPGSSRNFNDRISSMKIYIG